MSTDPTDLDLLGMADQFARHYYATNPPVGYQPRAVRAWETALDFFTVLQGMDVDLAAIDPTYWHGIGSNLGLSDDQVLGQWSESIRACCSGDFS